MGGRTANGGNERTDKGGKKNCCSSLSPRPSVLQYRPENGIRNAKSPRDVGKYRRKLGGGFRVGSGGGGGGCIVEYVMYIHMICKMLIPNFHLSSNA